MLWTDLTWPVVSKIILDGSIAQYLTDILNKALRLYEKGRRVLLATAVFGVSAPQPRPGRSPDTPDRVITVTGLV